MRMEYVTNLQQNVLNIVVENFSGYSDKKGQFCNEL